MRRRTGSSHHLPVFFVAVHCSESAASVRGARCRSQVSGPARLTGTRQPAHLRLRWRVFTNCGWPASLLFDCFCYAKLLFGRILCVECSHGTFLQNDAGMCLHSYPEPKAFLNLRALSHCKQPHPITGRESCAQPL